MVYVKCTVQSPRHYPFRFRLVFIEAWLWCVWYFVWVLSSFAQSVHFLNIWLADGFKNKPQPISQTALHHSQPYISQSQPWFQSRVYTENRRSSGGPRPPKRGRYCLPSFAQETVHFLYIWLADGFKTNQSQYHITPYISQSQPWFKY